MKRAFITLALVSATTLSHAQTIGQLGDRRICSTRGGEPLARQLAAYQRDCLTPGRFVRFHPHDNIILNYPDQIHPYLQETARAAVWSVADAWNVVRVSSAFRPISDQYLLWRSLGGPSACIDAAVPGSSRHQSGRALDLSNADELAGAMTSAGCARLSGDPPHFDCPGDNLGADSVRAFQALWNRNNPADEITEDGIWGPQTESRLREAPSTGFASAECMPSVCEPACEGTEIRDADCTVRPCGLLGTCAATTGTPVCASVFCFDGTQVNAGPVCTPANTELVQCNADGTAGETVSCECTGVPGSATCAGTPLDGGPSMDGGLDGSFMDDAMVSGDAGPSMGLEPGCGCTVGATSTPHPFGAATLLALLLWRRREAN